jgi:hypothetical protein
MNKIKFIVTCLIFFTSTNYYSQDFDGFKYVVIDSKDYITKEDDYYKICNKIANYFNSKGFETLIGSDFLFFPKELNKNLCKGLYVKYHINENEVILMFNNCKREVIKNLRGTNLFSYEKSLISIFDELDKQNYYSYNENLTPIIDDEIIVQKNNKSEAEIKKYLDNNKIDQIEGIYKSYKSDDYFKIGIVKENDNYKAIVLESNKSNWINGEIKAEFESTAVEGVFSIKYYNTTKKPIETFANIEGGLLNVELKEQNGDDNSMKFLKLYPKK